MSKQDSSTENHIKETAKNIFFKQGKYQATTQEIADAAGVNRTLLHYYFRSREILLEIVLQEGQAEFKDKMSKNINIELPFKDRISQLIDVWMEQTNEYPYLDSYLVSQMHNGVFLDNLVNNRKSTQTELASFYKDIETEMKAGRINKIEPLQFVLNLISMISYPLIMRPLLEKTFNQSKKNYAKTLEERKEAIMATIFK